MKHQKRPSLRTRFVTGITSMSYTKLFALWATMTIGFAVGYFLLSTYDHGLNGPHMLRMVKDPTIRFLDSLYYSIITATSTGYGDITPDGFSKVLAALQSISSLFVFAVFVTKLVSHRQEIALREVHRYTFEDVFHNVQEGLYIIRKDFDRLMLMAARHKSLTNDDWEGLATSYKQGQSLLAEVPDFYDSENDLYTLDARREELLQQAVHRTLHRINEMLDVFSENNIEWAEHDESMRELQELIRLVDEVTNVWRAKSPYEGNEAFEDILLLTESVALQIKQAVREEVR